MEDESRKNKKESTLGRVSKAVGAIAALGGLLVGNFTLVIEGAALVYIGTQV